MANLQELVVSTRDAEVLALMLGERRRQPAPEQLAADALAEMLFDARLVAHERLPADRVALHSRVFYEEPGGAARSVVVVPPNEADVALGRVSVLSPVGQALLGRAAGARAEVEAPGGRTFSIRIVEVRHAS